MHERDVLDEGSHVFDQQRRMLLHSSRYKRSQTIGKKKQPQLTLLIFLVHLLKFRTFAQMLQESARGNTKQSLAVPHLPESAVKKNLTQRVWAFFLVAFPFIDVFLFRYSFQLFPGPLGYGPLVCMYGLLPFFVMRYQFPVRVALMLGLVGIIGSSGFLNGVVEQGEFIKVFGSLILSYLYYWYLWQHLGEDVIKGFRIYLKGAILVSVIGLLLFVDSIVSFRFYELINSIVNIGKIPATIGIRVTGTLGEPTYFANAIAPAGFFALLRLFFGETNLGLRLKEHGLWLSRFAAVLILLALALSYSAMAFAGILISVVLHLLIKRKIIALLVTPLVIFALFSAVKSIPEINERIEGLQNTSELDEGNVHGSSAILYNHAVITWENFRRNPLFGTGLGSHAAATEKYTILRDTMLFHYAEQNAPDASSMFLRIASELGLFGILLTLLFLVRNYFVVFTADLDGIVLKMISAAFLVTILLQLLRQGNFILNGFPFFVYGYYFARKQFKGRMDA